MSRLVAPHTPRAARWLLAAAAAATATHVGYIVFGKGHGGPTLDRLILDGVQNALFLLSALICYVRVAKVKEERAPWLIMAVAFSIWGLGWIYYDFHVLRLKVIPYPTLSDGAWLSMYPAFYVSLVLLLRARLPKFEPKLWLDGMLAALGGASALAVVSLDVVVRNNAGSFATVATNLAYPVLDLLLLVFVLIVFALNGWRPGRTWIAACAGFTLLVVTDTVFFWKVVSGTYAHGQLLDTGWAAFPLFIALAAWQPVQKAREIRAESGAMIVVPSTFVLLAVSVLVWDHFHHIGVVPLVLSTLTLVAASARTMVTFRSIRALTRGLRSALAERERAEAAIQESRQRLRAIIDHAPAAIYLTDLDGRYLVVSRQSKEILGHEASEMLGKTPYELVPADYADRLRAASDHVVTTRQAADSEWHHHVDGEPRTLHSVKFPLFDSHGEVRAVGSIVTDVTERRRIEEERALLERRLHQSERLESIGQLAGGVAHDFNNLLAVILNCADFALEELREDQDDLRADLEEIKSSGQRAAALTRQLLLFSRREHSSQGLVNLSEVVRGMDKLIARSVDARVELDLELADDLDECLANHDQLEQLVMNLVVNARDAMPEGGLLAISTANVELDGSLGAGGPAPGRYVRLSIADSGCGMTPEVAARACEPFFTTKPRGSGTGFGLATAHGIVSRAGGALTLDTAPGKGCRVDIHLPAAPVAAYPDGRTVATNGRIG
jgi:PAS domain S-box-containing protein